MLYPLYPFLPSVRAPKLVISGSPFKFQVVLEAPSFEDLTLAHNFSNWTVKSAMQERRSFSAVNVPSFRCVGHVCGANVRRCGNEVGEIVLQAFPNSTLRACILPIREAAGPHLDPSRALDLSVGLWLPSQLLPLESEAIGIWVAPSTRPVFDSGQRTAIPYVRSRS
jgi:hypothetical protein